MRIVVSLSFLLIAGIATAKSTLDTRADKLPVQTPNGPSGGESGAGAGKLPVQTVNGPSGGESGASAAVIASETSGGALNGPKGPTKPGKACTKQVIFPKKKSPVSKYPIFTTVFGIGIMGSGLSDKKVQHIASIMAQLIDNDHDGCPDSPEIVTWMTKEKFALWFSKESGALPDMDAVTKANYTLLPAYLYDHEVTPSCAGTPPTNDCSDATLEEIWHTITSQGYGSAFPKVFSTQPNSKSKLTKAMDVARGGHFTSIPKAYPASAWYKYKDSSCWYGCQATEYIYWGVASWVGAMAKRTDALRGEFKFNTKKKLIAGDKLLSALIQDTTKYRLPTVYPNGVYKGCSTCSTKVNHGGKVGK